MPQSVKSFPITASGGDQVLDRFGNIWRYDAGENAWILIGNVQVPPLVTEQADGLIGPTIYSKLQYLRSVYSPADFDPLKILPGTDAYWYYWRSGDKTYRFTPEAEDVLRIEVDRARLYQFLSQIICPGPRGPTGEKGDTGRAGLPGPKEIPFSPVIEDGRLDFAIFTPDPLDTTPISVRLFKLVTAELFDDQLTQTSTASTPQLQALSKAFTASTVDKATLAAFRATKEMLTQQALGNLTMAVCSIPLSPVFFVPSGEQPEDFPTVTIEIPLPVAPHNLSDSNGIVVKSTLPIDVARTKASISYDDTSKIACGSVFLQAPNVWSQYGIWSVKSRQKGPKGDAGDPGNCRLNITNCMMDTSNVVPTNPLINVRVDCSRQKLYYSTSPSATADICVDSVLLNPNSAALAPSTVKDSTFASAQMTLNSCKQVNRYQFTPATDDLPQLELAHWEPQDGCVTQRSFDRHSFDWMSHSGQVTCSDAVKWFSPDGIRNSLYPGTILTAKAPKSDKCCQDSWFYLPNIQNGPCQTTPVTPPPPPPSPSIRAAAIADEVHQDAPAAGQDMGTFNLGAKSWQIRT